MRDRFVDENRVITRGDACFKFQAWTPTEGAPVHPCRFETLNELVFF